MRRILIGALALGAGAWAAGMGFVATRQVWPEPTPADAVLVLGTSSLVGGRPNPCMAARVAEGVRLVQAGMAPVLVVSGGFDPKDGLVEAETMAELAIDSGLAADQVLLETRATSSIENLTYSREVLVDGGRGERLIVVTEPFHLPRAMLAADRLGIEAQGAPSQRCSDRGPLWLVREPAAVLWYWWKLR
jgi:uncharacterized SAM-binding protein YcdF (DUF218 family)